MNMLIKTLKYLTLKGLRATILVISIFPLGGIRGAYAQIGQPWIHDPSTLAECDGKWYTFGTGGGGLVTDDGWSWHSGPVRPGGGAAPDVLKIGDRYLVAYSATGGGLGGGHSGRVLTMWNETLDPASPKFKYTEPIEVAYSDSDEDNDAIDAGLLLDPTTGRLWLTYGTYFGNIRIVELDPKTGARVDGNQPKDVAIDCEATDLIYRDGYYYLLGTHGTCCDGVNSTYNIVCGRSKNVLGPYLDNMGRDMLQGGGKMVISGERRAVGAGHFGRTVLDEGVEVMSFHWETDLDRSGRSVLAIRPLIWKNGWPVAGESLYNEVANHQRPVPDTYNLVSERHGYSLELSVDFVRMEQERQMWHRVNPNEQTKPLPQQTLDDMKQSFEDGAKAWAAYSKEKGLAEGTIGVRIGDYMGRPHQDWTIMPMPEAGGYLSSPYYTITITGTNLALTATEDLEVVASPQKWSLKEGESQSVDASLWRIEQLTDGTYRIMPKVIPGKEGVNKTYCLYSIGDSTPILAPYDFSSDNSKWNLKK